MMGKQLAWCPVLASIVLGTFPAGGAVATSARPVATSAGGVVIPNLLGPVTGVVDEQRGHIFLARRDATPGQVSVLDARSARILQTVGVGPAPGAMAVAAQEGRVFVVSAGDYSTHYAGSVATLDATSGRVLRSVSAGTLPNAVAVDAISRHALITTLTARGAALEVLDARTGAIVATALLGRHVRPIAVAAGAGRAIVVTSDDRVNIVDAATGQVLRAVQAGQGAAAVAVDSALGHAFIVNQDSNTVGMLDVRGGAFVRTIGVDITPSAVAVDATTHRVFVANAADHTVSVLDAHSGALLRTVEIGHTPNAMVADERAGLVVVAAGFGLSLLDAGTGALLRQITEAGGVTGMAIDGPRGQVIVSIAADNAVRLIALGAMVRRAPVAAGASKERTQAVVQAFIDAYNQHDLAGALALLAGTGSFSYTDWDHAHHLAQTFRQKRDMVAWLRARFAEHDRFLQARVILFGPQSYPPDDPRGAGIEALRTNDALRAQGRVGYVAAKLRLSADGNRISWILFSGS